MKPFQLRNKVTDKLRYHGAWLISYKAPSDGQYRRQIGGTTYKEAEKVLRNTLTDIERGVWVDPRTTKRKAAECQYKTFGDVCDAFKRFYSKRSKAAKDNLNATLKVLHLGVRGAAPLLPATMRIAELTPARLCEVRDAIDARPWATATKNLFAIYVRMIFRWAVKNPSVPMTANPAAANFEKFRAPGTRGGSGMIRAVGRDEVFSRTDAVKMLDYAFSKSELASAYMLQTAFSTGLRKGEIAGLKWCNVDFERRLVLVCRTYDRRGTKSGEDRTVPMPVELVNALRTWKAKSPYSKEHDPVFPDADGKHRTENFGWSEQVRRIAVGAEVARPGMARWGHGTRHFYATQWLLQGGSDSILANILGHRDTTLIHQVYAHFCDLDLVRALDRIGFTLEPKPEPVSALPGVVGCRPASESDRAIC